MRTKLKNSKSVHVVAAVIVVATLVIGCEVTIYEYADMQMRCK